MDIQCFRVHIQFLYSFCENQNESSNRKMNIFKILNRNLESTYLNRSHQNICRRQLYNPFHHTHRYLREYLPSLQLGQHRGKNIHRTHKSLHGKMLLCESSEKNSWKKRLIYYFFKKICDLFYIWKIHVFRKKLFYQEKFHLKLIAKIL